MDIELKVLCSCVIIVWACVGWIKLRGNGSNVGVIEVKIIELIAGLTTVTAVASLLVKIWQ